MCVKLPLETCTPILSPRTSQALNVVNRPAAPHQKDVVVNPLEFLKTLLRNFFNLGFSF